MIKFVCAFLFAVTGVFAESAKGENQQSAFKPNCEESLAKFEKAIQKKKFTVTVSDYDLADKHSADVLLISCVDFRLREEVESLMTKIFKLSDNYDEMALPGAALALVQKEHMSWVQTMEEVIGVLKKLHNIKHVIFLNHRGCGAFKVLNRIKSNASHEEETAAHKAVFTETRAQMKKSFPDLKVHTLLMGIDGVVENFPEE